MTRSAEDAAPTVAEEFLAVLYPPPYRVSVTPSRRGDRTESMRFVAVPSVRRARLVMSAGAPRASARAVLRQLSGRRPRTRIARVAIAAAGRAGLLRLLPRSGLTVTVDDHGLRFDDEIARRLGVTTVHLTLPVGPPRANRKPILQISDRRGAPLAFAKIGHNELTRTLVRSEARALRAIAGANTGGIEVPVVRDEFDWGDSAVLVISPLTVPTRRLTGAPARQRLAEVVVAVTSLRGRPAPCAWSSHPLRARLLQSLRAQGTRGAPFLACLESLTDDLELQTGAWHGDFNVGNFALTTQACPVWDWERFEEGVPVGFDLLHHDLHRWITVEGMGPEAAAHALIEQAPTLLSGVVEPGHANLTAKAYLVTLADRYLADNQENAGASLGAVTTWLLPALRRGQREGE